MVVVEDKCNYEGKVKLVVKGLGEGTSYKIKLFHLMQLSFLEELEFWLTVLTLLVAMHKIIIMTMIRRVDYALVLEENFNYVLVRFV